MLKWLAALIQSIFISQRRGTDGSRTAAGELRGGRDDKERLVKESDDKKNHESTLNLPLVRGR